MARRQPRWSSRAGETNLKIKAAPEETRSLEEADLVGLNAIIDCEGPNSRLYQFTGNLRLRAPLPPTVVAAMAAAQAMAAAAKAAAAAEAGGGEKEKLEQEGPGWGRAAAKSLLANGMEAHAATLKSMASTTVAASEPSRWNFRASQRRASTRVEPPHEYVASLAASAVVLRGCSLRNTTCIYGVVIYAGGWRARARRRGGWRRRRGGGRRGWEGCGSPKGRRGQCLAVRCWVPWLPWPGPACALAEPTPESLSG